jgi:hypothetical protein
MMTDISLKQWILLFMCKRSDSHGLNRSKTPHVKGPILHGSVHCKIFSLVNLDTPNICIDSSRLYILGFAHDCCTNGGDLFIFLHAKDPIIQCDGLKSNGSPRHKTVQNNLKSYNTIFRSTVKINNSMETLEPVDPTCLITPN